MQTKTTIDSMNSRGFTVIVGVVIVMIVIVGIMAFTFFSKSGRSNTSNPQPTPTSAPEDTEQDQEDEVPGTIRIEAKDGILTQVDTYDTSTYLAETSRGFEAYLANENAQITIPFVINSDQIGTYEVWIYTSDDGIFENGDRNATFFFDMSQKLLYQHKSEDTQGMVWKYIGNVSLAEGDHFVKATKRESTYAAFSFTSIKLVPVE